MSRSRLDFWSLASLAAAAPLMLFPRGALPWVGVALVAGASAWRAWKAGGLRLRREDLPLAFLAGMALVGLGISIVPELSLPRLWALMYGLLVFTTLRRALDLRRQAKWIAGGLALLGLGLAAVSLLGTDWGNVRMVDFPWLYERLPSLIRGLPGSGVDQASDLFNPRWVGMTMATLAPACLALVGWRQAGWVRLAGGLAFLALTGTLLLTQSVQGLMGWAVGVFVVLVCASRWFWLLLPAGLIAALGLVGSLDAAQAGRVLFTLDNPAGAAVVLRLDIWRQAWAMLVDMPFTGIGLNTFQVVLHEFYPGYLIGPEPHAHNLFLQTALDLGLPGLAALLWFLAAWGWRAWRALRFTSAGSDRLLLVGALAGVGAYLAAGSIDAMMLGAKPGFVVWGLLGIGAAVVEGLQPDPAPRREGKQWMRWTAGLALPVFLALAVWFFPGKAALNLGALQALHLLHPVPAGAQAGGEMPALIDLQGGAEANLRRALTYNPNVAQAQLLLGRLAAAAGNFEEAQASYAARVALDLGDPVLRYNLTLGFQEWTGTAGRSEPARELMKVYQAWNTRFPDRAETYLMKSMLLETYLEDAQGAQNTLQAGIQAQAVPAGLLTSALK